MTLNEAAALLGIHPDTLRVQVHKGKLRAKKVGPVWTVTPGEVERYRRESLGIRRAWKGHGIPNPDFKLGDPDAEGWS